MAMCRSLVRPRWPCSPSQRKKQAWSSLGVESAGTRARTCRGWECLRAAQGTCAAQPSLVMRPQSSMSAKLSAPARVAHKGNEQQVAEQVAARALDARVGDPDKEPGGGRGSRQVHPASLPNPSTQAFLDAFALGAGKKVVSLVLATGQSYTVGTTSKVKIKILAPNNFRSRTRVAARLFAPTPNLDDVRFIGPSNSTLPSPGTPVSGNYANLGGSKSSRPCLQRFSR